MGIDSATVYNVPEAYADVKWKLRIIGREEESERGPVIAMPEPFFLTIGAPWQRVLFDPIRDCNPYFHLMEAIWMLAGRKDAKFVGNFNRRIYESQEPDGTISGAYGNRWRNHFHRDQIVEVVKVLCADPHSRRAVVAMWDPAVDTASGLCDRPCNTHIYLRIHHGALQMTVCNRSNDFFWGMLGANAVHMTFLHEFLARALNVPMGSYNVFTNNLHAYTRMPRFEELWEHTSVEDWYISKKLHASSLAFGDSGKFLHECELFCNGRFDKIHNEFLRDVAVPMYESWMARKSDEDPYAPLAAMPVENDWREAACCWLQRHKNQLVVAAA